MLSLIRKLFFILILIPQFLFSQNNDSIKLLTKNNTTNYFSVSQFEYPDSLTYIQNTLNNFQNYLERGNLGNNGLPFNDPYFKLSSNISNLGFNYSKNNFENYFYIPGKLKFYNTRTPFSDLFYVIGSKKEQVFNMTFSYNVKKNWNITAFLNRVRSEGFYLNQNTQHNLVAISSNYKTLNNRYNLLASVTYNNAKNQENGGIAEDSVFFAGGITDKKQLAVNLTAAKRQTIYRSIFLKQFLNFGPKSTDTSSHNAIIPKSRLVFTTLYDNNISKYTDNFPSSGYYSAIYYDSTNTFDSIYSSKIENEIAWKLLENKKSRGAFGMIGLGLNLKHQLLVVEQGEIISLLSGVNTTHLLNIDTAFSNIITGAELYNTFTKNKFWWHVAAKYAIKGYNKNDYYAVAIFKKAIKDSSNIVILKLENKLQAPDFIYVHYTSNNFKWNNNFSKTHEYCIMLNLLINKYNMTLGAAFTSYSNVLFFNDLAMASQYKGSIPVFTAFLKKDFTFSNFHINNKINYQHVPDYSVIRVPEFILEHSLYYENDLFKNAMRLQIGFSLFYNSAYYSNQYMPATGQFYFQDKNKYGNYPFVDFFINARVKTVRIFFKIDHFNYGMIGNNYMLSPHYPMNDRVFKFGVSWRFFD